MTDGHSNVDATVMKLAKDYQASKVRSNNENEIRANIRENIEKIGIDPTAFQHGLRMAEDLTTGERSDYTGSLTRVLSILDGNEADLFGAEEMRKRDERKAKAAEKAAKAQAPESSTDDNPRGDPKKGGAGGVDGKKPAKDAKPKPVENKVSKRKGKGGDNVVSIGKGKKATAEPPAPPASAAVPPSEGDRTPPAEPPVGEPPIGDPPPDDEGVGETGDQLIERVSREKMAELEQREGAAILERAPKAGDKPVDNGPANGLGSISDEGALTDEEKAARATA